MSRARAVALAAAALVAAGCHKARTEAVVVVSSGGIRVPDDVSQVRLLVSDRAPVGDDTVFDHVIPLCDPSISAGCYQLPLSAVLIPGPKQPDDSVRIEVDGLSRDGSVVIADAALFTFSTGKSLRLDFLLYPACIGLTKCAHSDQTCDDTGRCTNIRSVAFIGEPDLGLTPPPADLSQGGDVAVPPGADLAASPPDFARSVDLAGCAAVVCQPNETCVAGQCYTCGKAPFRCCDYGCEAGNVCDGTYCQPCGNPGQFCCDKQLTCNDGQPCQPSSNSCPFPDMAMSRDLSGLPFIPGDMGHFP
jgi:hypothetical protein